MPSYQDAFNVTAGFAGITALYASDTDTSHAAANSANLNAMIVNLLSSDGETNGKGGTLVFPAGGTYYFDGGIIIGNDDSSPPKQVPSSIILRGSGAQNRDYPALEQLDTTATFFTVNNSPGSGADIPDEQIAGIVFQDLIITFNSTKDDTEGVGIHVQGGSNARIQRVTFDEVPNAAVLLDDTLHCSIIDCNIRTSRVQNGIGIQCGLPNGTAQAKETYVAGTTLLGVKTGGTGLVMYGADHFRMANCRIEGWTQGINIEVGEGSGNVFKAYFGNVGIFCDQAAAALNVSGSGDSPSIITQVWFAECEFGIPNESSTSYKGGGVVIGPTDDNNIIDQIRFVDCYSSLWLGPGMDIQGGTNIEILGGHYSCNGTGGDDLPEPYSSSGIALSGPASGVRISNVACNNSVFNVKQLVRAFAPATQNYGIYVTNGASGVRIIGCDLTGPNSPAPNLGNNENGLVIGGTDVSNVFARGCDFSGYDSFSDAVKVNISATNLNVMDSAGYNDLGVVLSSSVPTSPFSAVDHAYYGPATFYGIGANLMNVIIDSAVVGVENGTFNLAPGQEASLIFFWGRPYLEYILNVRALK